MFKINIFIVCIILFTFTVCKKKEPVSIQKSEHECSYCHMQIEDLRFNTQFITEKGKLFHFDSISCMARWEKEQPIKGKSWVSDMKIHGNDYIPSEQAFYIQSEHIHSPMRTNLGAYKTNADVSKFVKNIKAKQEESNYKLLQYKDIFQHLEDHSEHQHQQHSP